MTAEAAAPVGTTTSIQAVAAAAVAALLEVTLAWGADATSAQLA